MKNITRYIVSLILVTIFANLFFFRAQTPLSIGLFLLGFCLYILAVAERQHRSMILLFATSIYAVFTLWARAAHFIQIQSILTIIALGASLWYVSISESESFASFTAVFLSPIFAALTYIKRAFALIKPATMASGYKRGILLFSDRKKHSHTISTLIGLAIAFPVMLILVVMFSAADPIYYSYLKNIISPDFLQQLPWRIVLSFLLLCFAVPFVFPKLKKVFVSPGQLLGKLQMTHELTIVMAIVSLVIASFIIIQWPYVFVNVNAETDLSRFGVATYAEYVKKGFIELLRASAFIYALLWLGLTALRQNIKHKSQALSVFQWIVMSEFFIILISIARRVYLYQLYHGLTLIRIYGTFFLIWLFCMTITIAGRHITNKIRFGYIEGVFTILLFVFLGTWNVEQFIVATHPPTVNKRVDYIYLARMSADGVNGWINAYTHAKQIIEKYTDMEGYLDKNARREIAYAEYIIRRMTYNYYNYMSQYASPSEMKTYINIIVDFQIQCLERERRELVVFQKIKPGETWVKDRLVEIDRIKNGVEKIKTQSLIDNALEEIGNTEQHIDISIDSWQNMQTFEMMSSPIFHSFYNSNTAWDGSTIAQRYVKITALDRLYAKNRSDTRAFQAMKQYMSLDELHELQIKYYDLYNRIGGQSTRDYEVDISLDSPLL